MSLSQSGSLKHSRGAPAYSYRNGMGLISSAEHAVFFDDFRDAVTTNVPLNWAAAIIDTGATVILSNTLGTDNTGSIVIGSDGADEGASIYLPERIQLLAGKRFWMEMRYRTALPAETSVQMGLSSVTATTNPEDLWLTASADVLAFGTLLGVPSMLADLANAGTAVVTGTTTTFAASPTWHTLGMYFDGVRAFGYVNGKQKVTTATTIPVSVTLAPFVGALVGATAANVITIDYFRYVQER
jgi:hypothetical protein